MVRRKKILLPIILLLLCLTALYWTGIYFLVSACLVPSFMEKLDDFSRITEESYAQQVQTEDIQSTYETTVNKTNEWLKTAQGQYLSASSEDGYKLIATEFFAQESDSHRWVLLLHGYTGWKEAMYPLACWYYEQDFHCIVPDLRCQGSSEGDFIGMGWTDHFDCMLWIRYILKQDPEAEILIHGQSMGAATALIMTGDSLSDNVRAVVSDCSYTDAYTMFGDKITQWFHLPPFPFVDSACLMLRLRGGYDLKNASALNAVKNSSTPTLFIHGEDDAMISAEMSRQLYDAASCEKDLLIVSGAGHCQVQDKDPERYYSAILDLLQRTFS